MDRLKRPLEWIDYLEPALQATEGILDAVQGDPADAKKEFREAVEGLIETVIDHTPVVSEVKGIGKGILDVAKGDYAKGLGDFAGVVPPIAFVIHAANSLGFDDVTGMTVEEYLVSDKLWSDAEYLIDHFDAGEVLQGAGIWAQEKFEGWFGSGQ